jgi:hypothetical protein
MVYTLGMKVSRNKVEQYLDSLKGPAQSDIKSLYEHISNHMPGVQPKLWEGVFWGGSKQSIIGFGDLTYSRSDKRIVDWFMVGLTQQKNYISIYINATEDGQYIVKKYSHLLGKAKCGSSSISFKKTADVNMDELLNLIDIAYKQLQI